MSKKLYVGNLAWSMKDDELKQVFSEFGEVEDAFVMMDRATGRSKGFGFVTFTDEAAADAALEAMNGKEVGGRAMHVDVARPPKERNDRY